MRQASARTLYVHCPCRDPGAFRSIAVQAARLRELGRVAVIISDQVGPDRAAAPAGRRSPWHDYAITSPGMHRFFPHPLVEPHLDMAFVGANRSLWHAKAAILAEYGLEAAWWGVEPHFLPHAFFIQHPHLRGARCDHPRRSRREEFSPCPDCADGRELIAGMVERMRRATPNLAAIIFKTNDAGGTLCWAEAGYDGRNGPGRCRDLSPGEHMANFVGALHEGARRGGGDVQVVVGRSNFWGNEVYDVGRLLPPGTSLSDFGDDGMLSLGGLDLYPARCVVEPIALLADAAAITMPQTRHVFVHFRSSYDRAGADAATVEKAVDVLLDGATRPATTPLARAERLRQTCAAWAGEAEADTVMAACESLHRALRDARIAAPRFNLMYTAVSLRHLTRPLLFDPRRLTPADEAPFLPYVFNPYESVAREDYIDLHGGRIDGCAGGERGNPALLAAIAAVQRAARTLEAVAARGAPAAAWLNATAVSYRLWTFCMRSTHNFYYGQLLRDRHEQALARTGYIHPQQPTREGEGEILSWKALQRDELENAEELLAYLEQRGIAGLVLADDPAGQDTFTLGPAILDDLRHKIRLMREHWLDVEDYLAPPLK